MCATLNQSQASHATYWNVTGSFCSTTMCSNKFVSCLLVINELHLKIVPATRAFTDIYQRLGCDTYGSIQIERMTVTLAKPTYIVVHENVITEKIVISEIANMTSLQIEIKPVEWIGNGKPLLYRICPFS